MINTKEDKALLESVFYAEKYYLSYSALNKLVYAPKLFYKHYILNQRDEETTPALLQGKIIHCLLLDDGSFNKQFVLLPGNFPSDNSRKVIHHVYEHHRTLADDLKLEKLADYEELLLSYLKEINLHQSLKTDKQRIEKIATLENEEYFSFLCTQNGREIVDIPTLDYCTEIVELLKSNDDVMKILGMKDLPETAQTFNEIPMRTDLEEYPFGFKGVLDNVVVDFTKKYIKINDLKTTSKSVTDFKESVDFWNLWMQAAMYEKLVINEFLKANGIDSSDWCIEFRFVVVDKYQQVYPFLVTHATMQEWKEKLSEKLKEAAWHYENRDYSLPYNMVLGNVTL